MYINTHSQTNYHQLSIPFHRVSINHYKLTTLIVPIRRKIWKFHKSVSNFEKFQKLWFKVFVEVDVQEFCYCIQTSFRSISITFRLMESFDCCQLFTKYFDIPLQIWLNCKLHYWNFSWSYKLKYDISNQHWLMLWHSSLHVKYPNSNSYLSLFWVVIPDFQENSNCNSRNFSIF